MGNICTNRDSKMFKSRFSNSDMSYKPKDYDTYKTGQF